MAIDGHHVVVEDSGWKPPLRWDFGNFIRAIRLIRGCLGACAGERRSGEARFFSR
jgi:hypothetical protein